MCALPSLALALILAGLLGGCGPERDPDAPLIQQLRFTGQAPKNVLVLLFAADFEDVNGDLSGGTLTPYVNRQETGEQALTLVDVLLASGLSENATQGELRFNLEIEMSLDPATRPGEGATFDVGIEIQDAAGKVSNRPHVTLKIDYP